MSSSLTDLDPMAPTNSFSLPPVVCFTGWHNSGKTTLASQVVATLKTRGYRVAVIKSTKEVGLSPDPTTTDTAIYRRAGADSVALLAPDQLILRTDPPQHDLLSLVRHYFEAMDLVIAEGFKHAEGVDKIEVRHGRNTPLLRDQVPGVAAVATNQPLAEGLVFRLDQAVEITDFIVARFLTAPQPGGERHYVTVNGRTLSLPEPIRSQLAALLRPLVASMPSEDANTVELSLRWVLPPEEQVP